jgi:hypothetical protein
VKTGWASAVLVTRSKETLCVLESRRVELSDPAVPESRQPYHAGFGTARVCGPELSRLIAGVKRFGEQSLVALLREFRTRAPQVCGAGIVVGSLIDPKQIANDHIRIHALEGQLFRELVHDAAVRTGLRSWTWRERDLLALASDALRQPPEPLHTKLTALGREVNGPSRAEQKSAALAAWIVLAQHAPNVLVDATHGTGN